MIELDCVLRKSCCDTLYPDIHINKKTYKNVDKQIHVGKMFTFTSLLPNRTY